MSITEFQKLTLAVLCIGLASVIYLVQRIVKVIHKHYPKYAHGIYLLISIFSLIELIIVLINQQSMDQLNWYKNPFLFFWFIIFVYFLIRYILEFRKMKGVSK